MKTFITALKIVGIVLGLLIAAAYLLPRKVFVQRSLVINKEAKQIFCQVNNLKNWDNWSVWHLRDPNMKKEYAANFSGEGASYSWDSKDENLGQGSLSILKVEQDKYILTALDLKENGIAESEYLFKPVNGGTEVTLTLNTDMGYNPVSRYFGLFLDDMLGGDFEENLKNLKAYTENGNYIPCDAKLLATKY